MPREVVSANPTSMLFNVVKTLPFAYDCRSVPVVRQELSHPSRFEDIIIHPARIQKVRQQTTKKIDLHSNATAKKLFDNSQDSTELKVTYIDYSACTYPLFIVFI